MYEERETKYKSNTEIALNKICTAPTDLLDIDSIQKEFHNIILSLGTKDNVIKNLCDLDSIISDYQIDIHQFELNVLINLYYINPENIEQNEMDDFLQHLSSILSKILTDYPDEIIDSAIRGGIIQISADLYPKNHISQVLLPLIAKSGEAAIYLIENGILNKMMQIIQNTTTCEKYSILCIGAFGYYPIFSNHLIPFAPILFDYFISCRDLEIRYSSGKALNNLILCDEKICNSVFNDEGFDVLLDALNMQEVPELNEIIIELISSIISRQSIHNELKLKAVDILTPKFEEFLDKYSDASVLDLICCLVDAFADGTHENPIFIQKLIENNILQLCFEVYDLDLTRKLRIHFILLTLKSFINASIEQIPFFLEFDIIKMILSTINMSREQMPRTLLEALVTCCGIIERDNNEELLKIICDDPNVEDSLEALSQSEDYEIKYIAADLMRTLNFVDPDM